MEDELRVHPAYAEGFQCIGSACEDICCKDWAVPIERSAWEKYQALPEGPFRILLDTSIVRAPESKQAGSDLSPARSFAEIRMNEANHCPLLTTDHLCRIQSELGADMLSHVCATYPRIVNTVGGVQERALTFSCPEAVRLVLLTPELPLWLENPQTDSEAANSNLLPAGFWPIRLMVIKLLRARSYPLWQRLFLLKLMCQRLDSIAHDELKRSIPAFLADFEAAVGSGSLRTAMESLPVDRTAQLDLVLRLAGLMLHKAIVTPRFVECIRAFTTGIGNVPGATIESLSTQYALAHDRYYAPFFDRHPHIMENILINTFFRTQFPFGSDGMRAGAQPQMSREFVLLAAQFALIRGLLIGVAGYHGAAFSEEHVVHTVQAASKHFEHHPAFLNMAYALLVETSMDGARGLAILLRNAETERRAGEDLLASIAVLAQAVALRTDAAKAGAQGPQAHQG